ncbi:transcription termination/antitermination protein NusA [bacterium (Candidatus Blackallbacteria) CG17_big_fil_post_rev_8_21_14_2_50_48_46]|uniref:Transcription termination/antitermination protein NusA n=1 Tax=bacterium (Candidatus Blackallbacteria) CG17_big_fil_post_rev_8_21_14_2_50_48_46 TaxID=2014261 RepID=A0A2M7G2Q2_9BACT|nr:MAG: transcription termination/antitermination protein NusA [bacterium (Candidatus Blackallbacteria) CG18_big_fil_WC_8_21_14_2_50_49_26]PIW16080.1 MAG: transcription termination/antitermination protein NusA [bacterium (Candidatus Blackallbacteria) CG17_big_fil_post_rev_8_21_14_2_50_48_46]PIW50492.1 MAG: transcription termination/antitermination protein NusA [bacterium (Candidatus Blackallbacteria) CG13_big_fil_rev_8_21_14_2_50_49_14]
MKLAETFTEALKQIERERGISAQSVIEVIESALLGAYRKKMQELGKMDKDSEVELRIDTSNQNEIKVYMLRQVVEGTSDNPNEVSLKEAQKKHPEAQIGQELRMEMSLSTREFERLATQVAKQAITQRLREAEKKAVMEEYRDRVGTMVTATVQRLEKNNVVVKLNNKSELVLPASEQLPNDRYRYGDKVRVYLSEIKETQRGPHIVISRANSGLVSCLFEIEIPEVADGTVVIKSIARDAGFRTKVAVHSLKGNVDPVGACIGSRGSRIHPIIDELKGEKIDIVRWSEDLATFITNALSPAKVVQVNLTEDKNNATIIVPDDQLSLAIGREGQNVRLAAHLTNCHLDILTESELRKQKMEMQQAAQEKARIAAD